jgi:cell wall-associated NlpC family hydrolase
MPSIVDRHLNTPSLSKAERICFEAMFYLRTPYQYGSKRANALDGAHGTHPLGSTSDCSGFVVRVLKEVFGDSRLETETLNVAKLRTSPYFRTVGEPHRGDLICWDAHCGIVVDPVLKKFVGAQSSTGVAVASYATGTFATMPHRIFRRWWQLFTTADFSS